MKKESFNYSFTTAKPAGEVFALLLDVKKWWSGLFDEIIKGSSHALNDEFTFKAGDGVHYSSQKLVELIPDKKITWLVTDSRLNFLSDTAEWNGTKISFELSEENGATKVTFTHDGLVPQIECYESCSGAWTGYLDNLKKALK